MFTMLHLFANYQAVSVVSMETFNKNRLHLLMKGLLSTGSVSSPRVINSLEPVLRGRYISNTRLGGSYIAHIQTIHTNQGTCF